MLAVEEVVVVETSKEVMRYVVDDRLFFLMKQTFEMTLRLYQVRSDSRPLTMLSRNSHHLIHFEATGVNCV